MTPQCVESLAWLAPQPYRPSVEAFLCEVIARRDMPSPYLTMSRKAYCADAPILNGREPSFGISEDIRGADATPSHRLTLHVSVQMCPRSFGASRSSIRWIDVR